jgi:hypothetical protein
VSEQPRQTGKHASSNDASSSLLSSATGLKERLLEIADSLEHGFFDIRAASDVREAAAALPDPLLESLSVKAEEEKDFTRGGTKGHQEAVVPHRNKGDQ